MKGGVGKTTLAINIAHCLVEREKKRVLLVDIDPQFNATQCILSPQQYIDHMDHNYDTICTLFQKKRLYVTSVNGTSSLAPKELENIKPISISEYLDLLPGDLKLYEIEITAGQGLEFKLKRYLDIMKDKYDYVIIDTPPTPSIWMFSAIIASNYYIIPIKPDPLSSIGTDLLASIIKNNKENFNLQIKCLGLIFNMVENKSTLYKTTKKFFEDQSHWQPFIFKSYLSKRVDIAKKQTSGMHIQKLKNRDIRIQLIKIVDEFKEKLK